MILSALVAMSTIGSALAADLPSRKAPPPPAPEPLPQVQTYGGLGLRASIFVEGAGGAALGGNGGDSTAEHRDINAMLCGLCGPGGVGPKIGDDWRYTSRSGGKRGFVGSFMLGLNLGSNYTGGFYVGPRAAFDTFGRFWVGGGLGYDLTAATGLPVQIGVDALWNVNPKSMNVGYAAHASVFGGMFTADDYASASAKDRVWGLRPNVQWTFYRTGDISLALTGAVQVDFHSSAGGTLFPMGGSAPGGVSYNGKKWTTITPMIGLRASYEVAKADHTNYRW